MTDRDIKDLHPELQPICMQWKDLCGAQGLPIIITQTYRSNAEQDRDYSQGRTTPGPIITHAQGGQSPHNHTLDDGTPASLAFDFLIKDMGGKIINDGTSASYTKAGCIGKALGLTWGGDWPKPKTDYDHLELKLSTN